MATKFKILVLNGPNLNMLGVREPDVYGAQTLEQIISALTERANELGISLDHLQSNAESELINKIHDAYQNTDFIIVNPAAFTHTSVALRDALLTVNIPFVEVHLSNVHKRESFRHHSYLSDIAEGVVCGLGAQGYNYALDYAYNTLKKNN
ncbi:type II 3-dehydroquinate dehydratase [Thalassotalea aquiviva]|uniref:type II 3-dehydroquinate dehydratase n=1 Tax=Thalassotalea aquiviva TaxID=3242415 RepID=UPI00352B3346